MAKIYSHLKYINTRLGIVSGLVFFLLIVACSREKQVITIGMDGHGRAASIVIPKSMANLPANGEGGEGLNIRLSGGGERANIFGTVTSTWSHTIFAPLVPLTPGLSYDVFVGETRIGTVTVPSSTGTVPSVLGVFPSRDSLPENLLKFYFKFSHPMRGGESRKQIVLVDEKQDTLDNIFLDLQPELWDTTSTVLTLWIDPGRIKRDLQPNLRMGLPLKQGEKYTLSVSGNWKDTRGMALSATFRRLFTVAARDSDAPSLENWKFNHPAAGSMDPLIIRLPEPLDHFLLLETISILGKNRHPVKGEISVSDHDRLVTFTPSSKWDQGPYTLQVSAALEDLAGNNLNRLFDRDIRKDAKRDEKVYEKKLSVISNQ